MNIYDKIILLFVVIIIYSLISVNFIFGIIYSLNHNILFITVLCSFIFFLLYILLPLFVIFLYYDTSICKLYKKCKGKIIHKIEEIKKNKINKKYNNEIYFILLNNLEEKYLIDVIKEYSEIKLI